MACPGCGAATEPGHRFCPQCGGRLDVACPACGTLAEAGHRFCGACGEELSATGSAAGSPPAGDSAASASGTQLRQLTVVFLDLVGFTTLSEGRDPEDLRELLDRYFDRSRRIVARYGGTVAKFIGDAVLAVWGSPVAHDDDAERAVRAALDLVAEVVALGEAEGIAGLQARAGVTTGRVAVTVGAEHEGMVVGDRVNTASRIQGAAPPGAVLVDDATRRTTASAILYEDAGTHAVKGKDEQVRMWTARGPAVGREDRTATPELEPPFVGREREIGLVRDVFSSVVSQRTARMVAIVGQPGIGKSRLAREVEQHLDRVSGTALWLRGRCLAYGEATAYNAIAEMVRSRAGITEEEDRAAARTRLADMVERDVPDQLEQALVLPRLAQLLGLESDDVAEQSTLFAAWRVLFDRLADDRPLVLLVEDLQWADRGLLDFLDHLLDWARDRSILVLCLARPEIAERTEWSSRLRDVTTIRLEALDRPEMEALLTGLVPEMPPSVRTRIEEQAEGVPLFAVETVRMLIDRGRIVRDGDAYAVTGEVGELAVPETLHAIVAARLDGLAPDLRALVDDAAVLGQTFARETLRAVSGLGPADLDDRLRDLRAKDLVSADTDPLGADTGRLAFVQGIVRTVAYETLSRRERRRRHLLAARHLAAAGRGDELATAAASHYLDAYRADTQAEDREEIRTEALTLLYRSASNAESIAALDEAQDALDAIAELARQPAERAEALRRAGELAHRRGESDEARTRLRGAAEAFNAEGDTRGEALAEATLARLDYDEGRVVEAAERLAAAVSRLDTDRTRAEFARLSAELAREMYFLGRVEEATAHLDAALAVAEAERLIDTIADGLNTKALLAWHAGRPEEALALLKHAHTLGADASPYVAFRAASNLVLFHCFRGQWESGDEVARAALARARRQGDRLAESMMLGRLLDSAVWTGRWDEADALLEELTAPGRLNRLEQTIVDHSRIRLLVGRGDLASARALVDARAAEGVVNEQERVISANARVALLHAEGEHRRVVEDADEVTAAVTTHGALILYLFVAVRSAIALGEVATARRFLDIAAASADPANVVSASAIQLAEGRIAAAEGRDDAEALLRAAVASYADAGIPAERAAAQVDLAAWLRAHGRDEEADVLLDDAEATLTAIGAETELARLRRLRDDASVTTAR